MSSTSSSRVTSWPPSTVWIPAARRTGAGRGHAGGVRPRDPGSLSCYRIAPRDHARPDRAGVAAAPEAVGRSDPRRHQSQSEDPEDTHSGQQRSVSALGLGCMGMSTNYGAPQDEQVTRPRHTDRSPTRRSSERLWRRCGPGDHRHQVRLREPHDAIGTALWALLTHPDQLAAVVATPLLWGQVVEERPDRVDEVGERWSEPASCSLHHLPPHPLSPRQAVPSSTPRHHW
jgi:hypothetical protein